MGIWIEIGGLNPWPNSPMYVASIQSKIGYFSSVEMPVTSTTAHWYKYNAKTSNLFYWKHATKSTTIPTIMAQIPNWSLSTTWLSLRVCWSMGREIFTSPHELRLGGSMGFLQGVHQQHNQGYLCENKATPPHPSWLYNKYSGMCCLHPSIFWSQGWINQQYITPHSWTYWGTSNQYWWSYGFPPIKGYK